MVTRKLLSVVGAAALLAVASDAHAQWTMTQFAGCAESIGAGGGEVWVIGCTPDANSPIYRLQGGPLWAQQPGSAKQITVSLDGVPWVINAAGQIFRWTGSNWAQKPGCANAISVGSTDDAWVTGCTGAVGSDWPIFRWNGTSFVSQGGYATSLGHFAGGAESVWATNAAGNVYVYFAGWQQMPGAAATSITNRRVLANGRIWQWNSSTSNWTQIFGPPATGSWKQVAGDWVIKNTGEIYHAYFQVVE